MVQVSADGPVTRIRLASPSTRNQLNDDLTRALLQAFHAAEGRCLLLEAEGPVFASGSAEASPALVELLSCREWLPRPLVAAVQGPAAGAGVALLANAHVVLAAQGASFALTEIREARWPQAGWPALAQTFGPRQARALALTGRVFSAAEALQWGLLHELTPAIELDDRASATAAHLAALDPAAIQSILRAPLPI
jgi:methylglutaconyl-CoA hydratase